MPNELISLNDLPLTTTNLSDLTTAENFFRRLQLYGSKSNFVTEGKVEPNHYGIPEDDEVTDLGAEVDAVLLSWRPKALSTNEEPILESFDAESDVFKDIQARSTVKDSGCMFGPEFLLWVPSVQRYLTFFMSSKTARREARKMEPLLRCAVTLKSRIIKQGKFVWTGPVVIACSTPIDLPPAVEISKKVSQFLNPPDRTPEAAPEDNRER